MLLLVALGVVALANLSETVLTPSIWLSMTIQAVEVCGFFTATLVGAGFVLRGYRFVRREWRQTFRR